VSARFDEIAELFHSVEGTERLELLLDYSDQLPDLPTDYAVLRDAGLNMVHECQSPVFLMVERDADRARLVADVPREAPTARGFASVLVQAFDGATAEQIASAPADALHALGLDRLLGMQRTRGLRAVYNRMRGEAQRVLSADG
jgi:cysteine desulfuration protein SufE